MSSFVPAGSPAHEAPVPDELVVAVAVAVAAAGAVVVVVVVVVVVLMAVDVVPSAV